MDTATVAPTPALDALDSSVFAAHAAIRLCEMAPDVFWNALKPGTRRWWLDIAGCPLGWRMDRWGAIPETGRRDLKLRMQQIMVLLTGAGLDLSGLRK